MNYHIQELALNAFATNHHIQKLTLNALATTSNNVGDIATSWLLFKQEIEKKVILYICVYVGNHSRNILV